MGGVRGFAASCALQLPRAPYACPCALTKKVVTLLLQGLEGGWDFRGTWQDTFLCARLPGYVCGSRRARRVEGLQSDLLYTPWL